MITVIPMSIYPKNLCKSLVSIIPNIAKSLALWQIGRKLARLHNRGTGYELHKPVDASSAPDALASRRSESTPSRNETGAGKNKIAQSLKIITRGKEDNKGFYRINSAIPIRQDDYADKRKFESLIKGSEPRK